MTGTATRRTWPWLAPALVLVTLTAVVPVAGLLALCGAVPVTVGWWALTAYVFTSLGWIPPYAQAKQSLWYIWLNPLASAVMFWIFASASWRGQRVEWKGRQYISR